MQIASMEIVILFFDFVTEKLALISFPGPTSEVNGRQQ